MEGRLFFLVSLLISEDFSSSYRTENMSKTVGEETEYPGGEAGNRITHSLFVHFLGGR